MSLEFSIDLDDSGIPTIKSPEIHLYVEFWAEDECQLTFDWSDVGIYYEEQEWDYYKLPYNIQEEIERAIESRLESYDAHGIYMEQLACEAEARWDAIKEGG